MIGEELRAIEEEKRMARAVAMKAQGAWLNWEDVVSRNISWNMLWKIEPLRIRFLIRATYDQLPTPTNLLKWGMTESKKCSLCDRPGNLEHILLSCRTALTQGRFTWRHNQVLGKLAHHLELKRSLANKATRAKEKQIQFVKAGQKSNVANLSRQTGLLLRATDWEMSVDLRTRLQFPVEIMTSLRPDLIMYSRSKICIIMVELTIPWETRIEEAFERKKSKYSDLCSMCEEAEWQVWCFPVEIGDTYTAYVRNTIL